MADVVQRHGDEHQLGFGGGEPGGEREQLGHVADALAVGAGFVVLELGGRAQALHGFGAGNLHLARALGNYACELAALRLQLLVQADAHEGERGVERGGKYVLRTGVEGGERKAGCGRGVEEQQRREAGLEVDLQALAHRGGVEAGRTRIKQDQLRRRVEKLQHRAHFGGFDADGVHRQPLCHAAQGLGVQARFAHHQQVGFFGGRLAHR